MVMGRQAGMERLFQSTPESGSSGKKDTEHSAQDAAACSGAEVEVVVVVVKKVRKIEKANAEIRDTKVYINI